MPTNAIEAVNRSAAPRPVPPQVRTDTGKAAATAPPSSPSTSVKISGAAKVALQEATETATQTAKEARSGDHQAQRALAKASAKK